MKICDKDLIEMNIGMHYGTCDDNGFTVACLNKANEERMCIKDSIKCNMFDDDIVDAKVNNCGGKQLMVEANENLSRFLNERLF